MDVIGLRAWAIAQVETLRVEIWPLVRSSRLRQLLYLTTAGQLKGFRYAWNSSLSAHWKAGRRLLVARRAASIAWDAVCLRVGEVHMIRHYLRTSYEDRRSAPDRPEEVAEWYPGQGRTWGDHQQMRDRAVKARGWEVWAREGVPPELLAEAERLMDRYDALAIGDPLPEDRERFEAGRSDAAEFAISAALTDLKDRVEEAIASRRERR